MPEQITLNLPLTMRKIQSQTQHYAQIVQRVLIQPVLQQSVRPAGATGPSTLQTESGHLIHRSPGSLSQPRLFKCLSQQHHQFLWTYEWNMRGWSGACFITQHLVSSSQTFRLIASIPWRLRLTVAYYQIGLYCKRKVKLFINELCN